MTSDWRWIILVFFVVPFLWGLVRAAWRDWKAFERSIPKINAEAATMGLPPANKYKRHLGRTVEIGAFDDDGKLLWTAHKH